jgi:MFS transporter, PHS family, inorganic phosphate transporter
VFALSQSLTQSLQKLGKGNIILSLAGLVPGYWFSVLFIDTIGRKRLQSGGFLILTVIFCIFGFGFNTIPPRGLVVLVCMANFFCGFGPNSTTFIIPGEVFPTRYRSIGHGISAAAGKIGAIISQALVGPLRNKGGPNAFTGHVMQIFALFMYTHLLAALIFLGSVAFSPPLLFQKRNAKVWKNSRVSKCDDISEQQEN